MAEIENARQYSQPDPPVDYNAVLLGSSGEGEGGDGEWGGIPAASAAVGQQALGAQEGEILRTLQDTMQSGRMTGQDFGRRFREIWIF